MGNNGQQSAVLHASVMPFLFTELDIFSDGHTKPTKFHNFDSADNANKTDNTDNLYNTDILENKTFSSKETLIWAVSQFSGCFICYYE